MTTSLIVAPPVVHGPGRREPSQDGAPGRLSRWTTCVVYLESGLRDGSTDHGFVTVHLPSPVVMVERPGDVDRTPRGYACERETSTV